MPKKEPIKKSFNINDLLEQQRTDFNFVQNRIQQLRETRKNVYGVNLEQVWNDADRDYIPHTLKTKGKRVMVSDEEKGWRSALIELEKTDDWRSDLSQPNVFVKIQTALSILIDRNPTGIFTPGASKFESVTALIKQLYQRNWEIAKSKQQLKLFIYNLTKYGWAIARTYPLRIARKVRNITEYNEEEPDKSVWEEKEAIEFNDVFRENLDPWNAWIDDMAKPNNPFSLRDWCWRKVYAMDAAKEEFGNYLNWQYVQVGGIVDEKTGVGTIKKKYQEKNLLEVYFYENKLKDLFMVIANGVPVVIEPLPVSDASGNKRLSCWQTYWTLRHAESPFGIGVYEAMRYDQAMLDRIRNMTIDQLTLAIYKMWFYQGTESLTETGIMRIKPGVGKQVMNPKDMKFLEIPGPGVEAWKGIEMFKNDVNEASGITEPLMGTIVGKTAFEIAQAKEAALKRLKTPLDNVSDALEEDGYITVSLIQLIYSIPETIKIADPKLIEDYLQEIKSDPELYSRTEGGEFEAKVFREIQLGLEEDEKGNLIETEQTGFFRVKPSKLKWEGIIKIKGESVLTPSKQLDKALDLEMLNIVIPLIGQVAQEMQMAQATGQQAELDNTAYGKPIKNILKLYEKDPKEWLPDGWFQTKQQQMPQGAGQPLFVPTGGMGQLQGGQPQGGAIMPPQGQEMASQLPQEAEKLVPRTEIAARPRNLAQRLIGALAKPFRKV